MRGYNYSLEECDVPEVRRKALQEYRDFRLKCLEYIHSEADTSVASQICRLAWHTAVFKTLNEARRLEPNRAVNGPMWNLIADGYVTLVTLGVRRLVDGDERSDSLWHVLEKLRKRPELLKREHYVCFDGVQFDGAAACSRYMSQLSHSIAVGGDEDGELISRDSDWGMSEILHKMFDRLTDFPSKRKRADKISPNVIETLIKQIESPVIKRVRDLANRRFAHAERIKSNYPLPIITFQDVDDALKIICRVTNFLSAAIFQDATFARFVPVPQYNVLENLDVSLISNEFLPELHRQWRTVCKEMDDWGGGLDDEFFARPVRSG